MLLITTHPLPTTANQRTVSSKRDDELALLYRCKQSTALTRLRLAHLLKKPRSVAPPQPKLIGQPWFKLQQLSAGYLAQYGSGVTTLRYEPPKQSDGLGVQLLWEDDVMADSESGANRQLGFLFLFDARRSTRRWPSC